MYYSDEEIDQFLNVIAELSRKFNEQTTTYWWVSTETYKEAIIWGTKLVPNAEGPELDFTLLFNLKGVDLRLRKSLFLANSKNEAILFQGELTFLDTAVSSDERFTIDFLEMSGQRGHSLVEGMINVCKYYDRRDYKINTNASGLLRKIVDDWNKEVGIS